jgi:hypothetical protein
MFCELRKIKKAKNNSDSVIQSRIAKPKRDASIFCVWKKKRKTVRKLKNNTYLLLMKKVTKKSKLWG